LEIYLSITVDDLYRESGGVHLLSLDEVGSSTLPTAASNNAALWDRFW